MLTLRRWTRYKAYSNIQDILTKVPAQVEDSPCINYIGDDWKAASSRKQWTGRVVMALMAVTSRVNDLVLVGTDDEVNGGEGGHQRGQWGVGWWPVLRESRKGGGRRFVQCCGVKEGKSESLRELLICIEKYRYTHYKIKPTHKMLEAPFIGRCVKDKPYLLLKVLLGYNKINKVYFHLKHDSQSRR